MVLVEHDAVPADGLYPFVCSFDAAHGILAQHVLERGEADEGLPLIYVVELAVLLLLAELPALEVLVRQEVFLPSSLDGGLEGEHQHLCPSHA